MRTTFTFLAVALLLCGFVPARAGTLDIVVMDTTAAPGTLGQFDIDLVNNSASAVTIGGFSVDVLLSDTTFVTFTSIDNATIAPYIFSILGSLPPGFQSNLLAMEVSGNDLAASGGQVVNPGETWGLAHVRYLVDPAAPLGTVVLLILEQNPVDLPPPGGTSLADANGNAVAFSGLGPNGTITVGTASVPEPASFAMLAMTSAAVLAARGFKCARG
jgi:hypothetical protein